MQNLILELKQWISSQLKTPNYRFVPLQGDASFRTYYRVSAENQSYIAMLAPPSKESTEAFVTIAKAWHLGGLQVPKIWAWEPEQGFVLLSDFGDTLLLQNLRSETADHLYRDAMQTLSLIQSLQAPDLSLPAFNEDYIRRELGYFYEWFLEKLLGYHLTSNETDLLEQLASLLIQTSAIQPQVTIHRDYHSRNLMVLNSGKLGIIDFQDAMIGPITYDLVSLLKDCYISWPDEHLSGWVKAFYEQVSVHKPKSLPDFSLFLQWFDWIGLQRHLKVLGIFSRLKLRDNKSQYINDIPRIIQYILQVTGKYSSLLAFDQWFQNEIVPRFQALTLIEKSLAVENKIGVALR